MTPQPSPTRPFTRSVLFVGNFLSSSVGNRNPCEELAPRLQNRGFSVLTVSTRRSRAARLFDMLGTCWAKRRHYDLAHVDVFSGPAFVWAEMVCWLLKRLGKPYVLTLHGGALPAFAQRWPGRVRRLLNSAQIVTAPSGYLQEHLSAYRSDIRLLPNGVDLQAYPYRRRDAPQPHLVWLRAFHRIYNPPLAVRVLARIVERFPTAHLTMVGLDKRDGSLQQTIDAARDLGVADHLVIRGAVSKTEVPFWIDRGDIFLNTSNVDNTPVIVVEALACGACVVSTDVGGVRYLLDDRHDALLVPPDDPDAMAEAVTCVLVEQGVGRRLSDNARLKAARFDWPSVLDQWECVLTSVSSARQRPEDQGLLRTRPHQPVWTTIASIGRFGEPLRRAPANTNIPWRDALTPSALLGRIWRRTARPFPPPDGHP
jgi:glycosyltransferase involved in cell wall biosynthesis